MMNRAPVSNQQRQPADYFQGIVEDVDKWIKSKMWPLSCYGFTMQGPSLPKMMDFHPDELRAEAYANRLPNGALNKNYASKYEAQQREHMAIRNRIVNCKQVVDVEVKKALEEFVSAFLKLREAKLKAPPQQAVQQTHGATKSLFEVNKPAPVSFSFKGAMATSNPNQAQQPKLFDVPSTTTYPTPQSVIPAQSNSLFNVQSRTPNPLSQPTPSMTGNKLFDIPAPSPQPVIPKVGQPTPKLFDVAPRPADPIPQPSMQKSNPLGASNKLFDTVTRNNNPVPQSVVPKSTPVVNTLPTDIYPFTYSNVSDLSEQELQSFQAEEFSRDCIPLLPPPAELCGL